MYFRPLIGAPWLHPEHDPLPLTHLPCMQQKTADVRFIGDTGKNTEWGGAVWWFLATFEKTGSMATVAAKMCSLAFEKDEKMLEDLSASKT